MAIKSQRHFGAALVTGGAKRLGQAIAMTLAESGYDIALHYHRSRDQAEVTARQIRQLGAACEIFSCDLGREAAALALIKQAYLRFPQLNLLVNSASLFQKSRLIPLNPKLLNSHLAVNFLAPYLLTSEFGRLCRKGQVINLLDANIVQNRTAYFDYLLSKKALAELTKMAAVALAPNIRVNGVCPGFILPPAGETTDYLSRVIRHVPLQRRGELGQIQSAVRFLLGNDYVTGQFIYVDGGEHLLNESG